MDFGTKLSEYNMMWYLGSNRGFVLRNKYPFNGAKWQLMGVCVNLGVLQKNKDLHDWINSVTNTPVAVALNVSEYEDTLAIVAIPVYDDLPDFYGEPQMVFDPNKEICLMVEDENHEKIVINKPDEVAPEYTEEQIKWCRDNAPESIKDVSDTELWDYMKESYNSFGKQSVKKSPKYVVENIYQSRYCARLTFTPGESIVFEVLDENKVMDYVEYYVGPNLLGWKTELVLNTRGRGNKVRTDFEDFMVATEFWVTVAPTDEEAQNAPDNSRDIMYISFWCNTLPETGAILDIDYQTYNSKQVNSISTRRVYNNVTQKFYMN